MTDVPDGLASRREKKNERKWAAMGVTMRVVDAFIAQFPRRVIAFRRPKSCAPLGARSKGVICVRVDSACAFVRADN